MPSPEERDRLCDAENFKSPPLDDALLKALEKACKEYQKEIVDARAKQCVCTALYTSALCPIHGPNYVSHLENRK